MEPYGPLYNRNGARLWPMSLTRLLVGLGLVVGVAEIILGIASVA